MTQVIVIDTNVLEYLFDDATHNSDGHIDSFLEAFVSKGKGLGLDSERDGKDSRILREYQNRLQYHIKQASEHGQRTNWLRYVLLNAPRVLAPVDLSDGLGKAISGVIGHMTCVKAETRDQRMVYVGIALDCVLVSDNPAHITNHATGLRRCARKNGSSNADFVSSAVAAASI